MIKIIKHGSTYLKIKCSKCSCEFCFSSADTYYSENPRGTFYYFVKCPECRFPNNTKNAEKGGEQE